MINIVNETSTSDGNHHLAIPVREFSCCCHLFKVAEQSFGSLWVFSCHLPNHGKRTVAAHKLKLGKWKIYWRKILIDR